MPELRHQPRLMIILIYIYIYIYIYNMLQRSGEQQLYTRTTHINTLAEESVM